MNTTTLDIKALEAKISLTVERALERNLKELQKLQLKFYSVDQIAEMLSVDPQSILKLCKQGQISYVRVGKLIRVEQKELLRWLETFN